MTRSFLLRAALCGLAAAMLGGAALPAVPHDQALSLSVTGLRSDRGMLRICLTSRPAYFPDCAGDPDHRHFTVAAAGAGAALPLGDLPPGDYAIAVVHDENGNRRLDTFAGIPREGFGFSENPPIRFGPPSFRSALFAIGDSPVLQSVRMKYLL